VLLRKLQAFVRTDFEDNPLARYGGDGPRTVLHVETKFDGEQALTIDLGPDVGPLLVRGKIDRIARVGDAALVIDYKTGGARIGPEELRRGRNFQMMLYLLAAQALVEGDPAVPRGVQAGVFWHIGGRSVVGSLQL